MNVTGRKRTTAYKIWHTHFKFGRDIIYFGTSRNEVGTEIVKIMNDHIKKMDVADDKMNDQPTTWNNHIGFGHILLKKTGVARP
jgi:hypothetical protein